MTVNAPILRVSSGVVEAEYGPQHSIGASNPGGAVELDPGDNIQAAITANANGTTFWLRAGTHTISAALVPKTGNTFVGEYGAIIDGTGWDTADQSQGAFRVSDGALIHNVTIRNLIIRKMPQKGIYLFNDDHSPTGIHGWVVEYCEIYEMDTAVVVSSQFTCQHCYIHDCYPNGSPFGGAYAGFGAWATFNSTANCIDTVLFYHNHIAFCGVDSHVNDVINLTFRNNWFHDVDGACMWMDGVGFGFLAEDNVVEDSGYGVHFELALDGIVRNNEFYRTTDNAVFISTAGDIEISGNYFEDCLRAIAVFVNFEALAQGWGWDPDCLDVSAHHNTIVVPVGGDACGFSYTGTGDLTPYEMPDNMRNNVFNHNDYTLVNPSEFPFYWTANSVSAMDFGDWQDLPQDPDGSQN